MKTAHFALTRWVPLVEQELLTLQEHLSSPPVFSGVCVTRSFVLWIVVCTFSFGHCTVCSSFSYSADVFGLMSCKIPVLFNGTDEPNQVCESVMKYTN
jgi:hypothetical protein